MLRLHIVMIVAMGIFATVPRGHATIAPISSENIIESDAALDSLIQAWKAPVFAFLSDSGPLEPAAAALDAYRATVSDLLAKCQYKFITREVSDEYKAAFNGLNVILHRILPDQSTKLGRLAARLESRYGVDLVYSPMMLELIGGLGTFVEHPDRSFMILTSDAIFSDSYSNPTNEHEMIHLKFWAYRKGLEPDFLPTAPVHASYQSDHNINPSAVISIYQNYMSFEELVAFAFNVSRKAEALMTNSSAERLASELRFEIKKMKVVSENVIVASEKALRALQIQSAKQLSYPGDLAGAFFEIGDGDSGFTLRIFMPDERLRLCASDCRNALVSMLTNAVKLANYNLAYLPDESVTNESAIKKAAAFEAEQRIFIETKIGE